MIGTPKQLAPKLLDLDQTKEYEIIERKKKRTRNQNSYYYELEGKLATKLRIPQRELHDEMVKKYCPFSEFLVPDEADLRALEYCEEHDTIKRNDKIYKVIRVYVGTHLLNTKEFGILLDNIIEECKSQGIETLTPNEIAQLKSLEK